MTNLRIIVAILCLLSFSHGLPMKEKKEENDPKNTKNETQEGEDWEQNLEYGRYLKEVVSALESDPNFRKKLESADVDDIKSGKISRELHLVDHKVRSKLDELKRQELERLRHIAIKEHEKKIGMDRSKLKLPTHINTNQPTKFESEDLRKLISQLNIDLEKVDIKRQEEFKKYEMEKEYKYQHDLAAMDEEHRNKAKLEHEEQIRKHKDHPKLHHPGSKQQLEEVWEEQDHMKSEDFDPKVFFALHDLDGNGYLDESEVKALFQKELDKMYDPNATEDDLAERYEEMERMREHVYKETDTDDDNLISLDEFMAQAHKTDFEHDEGWQGLDEQEIYSQHEYEEYERQRQDEIRHLVEAGEIPPPPGYHQVNPAQPVVYQAAAPQAYQAAPQGQLYQAVPQGYQAIPQGQVYQAIPQGQVQQAVPQGYQAIPQGQVQQAVPQGYQAIPQGQVQQAVPQGYQAIPQGQVQQAIPQGYQATLQEQVQQAVPQGYQAIPQGYQAPVGYQVVPSGSPAVPSGHQGVPQSVVLNVPHDPPPKPLAAPQGNLKPISHSDAMPQGGQPPAQVVPQPQASLQQPNSPQGPAASQPQGSPIQKAPEQPSQQQQVPQYQQPGSLNQHPEIKPIASNQLPGSN